ncbi:hypothetical protein [Roseisolibacter sp. H3M3-2]|uniref:hypothetical protein n=1 Tax=Roseisolibacter sp. H3M3-2 TaxID=3031323 RepID=UPI0023DAD34E|nr:hypothetical protein [Roseisolibacter sp. H3M3-2]MDF1505124.1 hypothetical protein [Roseisolibacter sp. H3M3-2]
MPRGTMTGDDATTGFGAGGADEMPRGAMTGGETAGADMPIGRMATYDPSVGGTPGGEMPRGEMRDAPAAGAMSGAFNRVADLLATLPFGGAAAATCAGA